MGVLFVLAGLCEIGGGYLVWGWMRDNKPLLWALVGAVVLALYGVVAALQPISEFGRVYAAYGGIFIALRHAVYAAPALIDQVGRPASADALRNMPCVIDTNMPSPSSWLALSCRNGAESGCVAPG